MATVIDALVVTLGLDASKYAQGQKQASASLKQTGEEATTTAKLLDAQGRAGAAFFTRLRNEALGFFAVIAGATGVKDLIRDITQGDAATGRLAHNLDMSTDTLAAWEGAAKRAGGSAQGMDGSLQGLMQQFQTFVINGESSTIPFLRALGVNAVDLNTKKLRPLGDVLLDLADKFSQMDPAAATSWGEKIGLDQGTINLLEKGRGEVQKLRDQQKQLGVPTDADATRAQGLQKDLLDIQQQITSLARAILNDLSPYIDKLLKQFSAWIQLHMPDIIKAVSDAVEQFGNYLATIPWDKVGQDINDFASGANKAADAVGGWARATEILFGLWAASKVLPIIAGITQIGAALAGSAVGAVKGGGAAAGASAAEGGGVMALLSRLAPLLFLGFTGPAGGENPEFSKRKNDEYIRTHPAGSDPITNAWHGATNWMRDTLAMGHTGSLMDLVGTSEGTDKGRGYNETLGYGKWTGGNVDLTSMSLSDVLAMQHKMLQAGAPSTAVGRYQIIDSTMRSLISEMNLNPDTTKFDQSTQDSMFKQLIKRRGFDSYVNRTMSEHDFMKGLSREWASLPDPDTGNSYYPGQHARVDANAVHGAISRWASNKPVAAVPVAPTMAPPTAAQRWGASSTTHNNDNSTQISTGPITIHAPGGDPKTIATGFRDAMVKYGFATQANTGLA